MAAIVGAAGLATDERGKRPTVSADEGNLLATVRNLWQYMWPAGRPDLKFRVILAIGALLVSKAATSVVPFVYKGIIDSLDGTAPDSALLVRARAPSPPRDHPRPRESRDRRRSRPMH